MRFIIPPELSPSQLITQYCCPFFPRFVSGLVVFMHLYVALSESMFTWCVGEEAGWVEKKRCCILFVRDDIKAQSAKEQRNKGEVEHRDGGSIP